jgi:hypothetical protein
MDAVPIETSPMRKHNKCRVFPILTTTVAQDTAQKGNNYWILQRKGLKGPSTNSSATYKQVQLLDGRTDWDHKTARTHLMNEAAMALRGLIVNTNNRINPLKQWRDVVWLYQWISTDADTTHCAILAFVPITPKDVPLAKPDDYTWVKLDDFYMETLTSCPEMERLLWTPSAHEGILRRVLGESIYAKETSPTPPRTKKNRSHGQFTEVDIPDPI